jgi:hypothetical protein
MAEEHLFLVLAVGSGPSLSDMPNWVAIARASLVAIWMSPDAPEVTFS